MYLKKTIKKLKKSIRKRSRYVQDFLFGTERVLEEQAAAQSGGGIRLDPVSGYRLLPHSRGYRYIPPRKPADFEDLVERMRKKVLFSIIMPTYNTPVELFERAVSSALAQWYEHWQLVIVDDGSDCREHLQVLERFSDPRIEVFRLPVNRGISAASNDALDRAKGDYIVLFDHDDELTVDCLYELALRIERDDADYLYSDEDKIDRDGVFSEPHFKPDWSPDTLMSTMYVCHVSCIRKELLDRVGRFRSEYDGCQDWDLMLRLTELSVRISHIPKVLYHWRIIDASVASDISAKPYVRDASYRVRTDALIRRGIRGTVEPVEQMPGYYRVNYGVVNNPMISIIIPTRDNHAVLARCISSLQEVTRYRNFEIVVLDNGSVDPGTLDYLAMIGCEGLAKVVRHDAPFNYSELNNIGINSSQGELLLFLNDDTEVIMSDWLERMAGYACLPHVGAVGAKLLFPGGEEIQHTGVLNLQSGPSHAYRKQPRNSHGYFMRNLLEYNWIAVTGACMMVERKKLEQAGFFDEELPVAYNDIELCFRLIDCGYYNVMCPMAQLIHHESVSRGDDLLTEEKLERLGRERGLLYKKHPFYFQHDPFFNVNFHPDGVNFELLS